jgi:hypothetical protein
LGEERRVCRVWWENPRKRDHLVDPGVEGKIILMRIFRNWNVGVWTGLNWLRIETGGGTCDELSSSIKCGELLD